MKRFSPDGERVMCERFGCDSVIALATATVGDGVPFVRYVNAYYEDGSFYVITYAGSNKMAQLGKNNIAAIAGEWFTGHARGENLGWFCAEENAEIAGKLRAVFAEWIDNGHNDFSDVNTIILRLELTDAVLWSHGDMFVLE